MAVRTLIPQACVGLHALLVIAHLVLLGVWAANAERSVVIFPEQVSSTQTYISLASQAIIIPYTALLVLLTQYVALRTVLSGTYTLTFVQDNASAWAGVGAALLSLWKQRSSSPYVMGIVQVTAYLACIAILHITTPSLFSWKSDIAFEEQILVVSSLPNWNVSATMESLYFLWDQANSYTLSQYEDAQYSLITGGLYRDILYDTVPADMSFPMYEFAVNATQANVSCGYIPNATVTQISDQVNVEAIYETYHFAFSASLPTNNTTSIFGLYNETRPGIGFSGSDISTTIQYVNAWHFDGTRQQIQNSSLSIPKGRSSIFLTTIDVTDDDGQHLEPAQGNSSVPLRLIGCTLQWNSGSLVVNSDTGEPATVGSDSNNNDPMDMPEIPGSFNSSSSSAAAWEVWRPEICSYSDWDACYDSPEVDSWAGMVFAAGLNVTVSPFDSGISPGQTSYTVDSLFHQLLAELFTSGQTMSLQALHYMLGEITATAYWFALHAVVPRLRAGVLTPRMASGQAYALMSQLHLNIAQVSIGMGASLLMLIIVAYLATKSAKSTPLVTDSSPMHIIWLVVTNKRLNQQIADVEDPTTDNLRRAGMLELAAQDESALGDVTSYRRLQQGDPEQ